MSDLPDHLNPADHTWLHDAALRRVFAVVKAGGGEARVVGGAVRDTLIGRAAQEVDLAVNLPPETVTALLATAGIKVVPTGIQHGTVTAVIDRRGFELTTLRRDVATDGRRATVAFTDDWRADAARRDFTFNAIYADETGKLYDYFNGRDDLAAGHLRFIGEAAARIREDVLRILRFFRFYAWFGKGEADANGLAACKALAGLIPQLSVERVWRETVKLLTAPDPLQALRLMQECGVLAQVLPEVTGFGRLEKLLEAERVHRFAPQSLTRLAALLPGDPAQAETIAKRLKLSGREAAVLTALMSLPQQLASRLDRIALRRELYAHGINAVTDALPLVAADYPQTPINEAQQIIKEWPQPRFPLQGGDIVKLGIPPGPELGTMLRVIESWWIAQDFSPDRAQCLTEAQRLIAQG